MQITADDLVNQEDTIHNVKVHVDRRYRDQQVFVDAAMLVGAVLILSVTFGGWLQFALGNVIWGTPRSAQTTQPWSSILVSDGCLLLRQGAGRILPMNTFHIKRPVS
ncbi:hypothetical protein MPTK1_6g10820 [Marchantia polymorpha subsp. ruderalis]|uniref:PGG domain-containing protein n=2 Tax=Marchantia polymorpha TaxID=3197 RepID=A0AAF6BQQ4_MARPO|nr:hypothetical protein MARPO_0016s0121 [Marchantia polymorpha]BBN14338.1 hypothetical protein Mp_6g10820 [Marchantia polymorpha subsp. ruderalis]|eukprot:PTQ45071.1 hypothetical protein MARPO_0016s0121 [Marchantia polymorpha]